MTENGEVCILALGNVKEGDFEGKKRKESGQMSHLLLHPVPPHLISLLIHYSLVLDVGGLLGRSIGLR